jgi:hypothetical protein
MGEWGMNTPNYFALDDVVHQPAASASLSGLTNEKIAVYPNPAKEYFMITGSNTESIDVQIISLTGQVVKSFDSLFHGEKLDVSDVPAGMYIVQFNGFAERLVIH